MTLLEHIYAVRNLEAKGSGSKDNSYSLELIAHLLNVVRATLTEQKADRYRYISEQSFQSLCIHLQKASLHNCCTIEDVGCSLLRSTVKIPKFLNTRWGEFVKVTTINGDNISKTSITTNKLAKYSLTNKKQKTGWFIHDGYLYIINNPNLEIVLLNSLYDNPAEIENLNCSTNTNGQPCADIYDTEYPIDPDLVEPLYKKVLDLLRYSLAFPPKDAENNAKDDQVSA